MAMWIDHQPLIRNTSIMTRLCARMITVVTIVNAVFTSANCACVAQIGESNAVWGLTTGDTFTANVVIIKQTEITVGDQAPTVSETRDRFQIQYQVAGSGPAGDIIIAARLQRPLREVGDSSSSALKVDGQTTKLLEELTMILGMDSGGKYTSLASSDRDAIVATFSGLDPSASKLLLDACPDSVIAGWFARPFWVAHDRKSLKVGAAWSRSEDIALGPFGSLRCDADLKLVKVKESIGSVEISANGRFIPLVRPTDAESSGAMLLTDVTAELDEYSGNARMHLSPAAEEGIPAKTNRPQFESIDVRIRFHGTATLPERSSVALKNEPPVAVSFRQTQVQSWILQDFSFGRPEIFFNEPLRPILR